MLKTLKNTLLKILKFLMLLVTFGKSITKYVTKTYE